MIIAEETGEIMATFFGKGKTRDSKLYQKSRVKLGKGVCMRADLGYWGLQTESVNVLLPQKNSKPHPLTRREKRSNRELARKRVKVENVIRRLKIFRILGERYRHRRKRLGLRFNLLSGIYNFERKAKNP